MEKRAFLFELQVLYICNITNGSDLNFFQNKHKSQSCWKQMKYYVLQKIKVKLTLSLPKF